LQPSRGPEGTPRRSSNFAGFERIARAAGDRLWVVELIDTLGDAITPNRSLPVLVAAGPYARLATSGAQVTVPNAGGRRAVADRLKLAGLLTKISV
jgi:hypothetical protein